LIGDIESIGSYDELLDSLDSLTDVKNQ